MASGGTSFREIVKTPRKGVGKNGWGGGGNRVRKKKRISGPKSARFRVASSQGLGTNKT